MELTEYKNQEKVPFKKKTGKSDICLGKFLCVKVNVDVSLNVSHILREIFIKPLILNAISCKEKQHK